jgi:peptidoglycan/xylan/chitin deacetylase (PgdA/CDA1 family)
VSSERPTALLAQPGRFVSLQRGDGAAGDGFPVRDLPGALPQALAEVEAWTGPGGPPGVAPTTLFLTIDTEDAYFDRPILMAGDGVGREFGVFGILDELDSRGLSATFFVNVYEKDRQPEGAVEEVVREIAARGHEVGLHTHPSPVLDFYRRPLFRLAPEAQVEALRWGAELIAAWTGEPPTSFRAGGYALNDDTFEALEQVGIEVDSSCFFPSPNNHNSRFTVNAVAARGRTVEVPVTTVLRAAGDGGLAHRKLDLDWLSVDELLEAIAGANAHGCGFAMFMMHSFSFIEKQTRTLDQPPSSRARFVSEALFDRYVEVYGPKPAMREAFATFLAAVAAEPAVRVRTLREALPDLRRAASGGADVVPVVGAR